MDRAIQKIFTQHFTGYASTRKLSKDQWQAARQFMQCRRPALGGHVEFCPEGHVSKVHYNSCRHRSCPQCNALQIERWLQKQKARLVDCPHHHMIFTLAHELLPLWRFNRRRMMNILFKAVQTTLFTFMRDERYLGATPGIICAFHSWGRDLGIHPHIHALVTDGGMAATDHWQLPKKRSHFLPTTPLMRVFRGTFCGLVHRALEKEELMVPPSDTRGYWHGEIKRCQSKKWNVRLQSRYDHGRGVANYLARYVRGGPVNNGQLSLAKKGVRLVYYDHRLNTGGQPKQRSTMEFTAKDFFDRYLQHIPEKGSQVVRSYGIYAPTKEQTLNLAREQHDQSPVPPVEPVAWQSYLEKLTGEDYRHCKTCQKELMRMSIEPCQQGPPGS